MYYLPDSYRVGQICSRFSIYVRCSDFPAAGMKHSLGVTAAWVTPPAAIKVGSQRVVYLTRQPTQNVAIPEFPSATILLGLGMNLFQITAK
jgi:hypothetical protein